MLDQETRNILIEDEISKQKEQAIQILWDKEEEISEKQYITFANEILQASTSDAVIKIINKLLAKAKYRKQCK
jgi:protein involved in ribonucleotide reduction